MQTLTAALSPSAGTDARIAYSLLYAPPETVSAIEAGDRRVCPDCSLDMWALGVIAYELLTASRVFPPGTTTYKVAAAAIAGRTPLPWESSPGHMRSVPELRMLQHTVLACLNRDAARRPTASALLAAWNSLFDSGTGSQTDSDGLRMR
jgi:serine/threonine protein kinase